MGRRFAMVDVFGEEPLRGNPLAVVADAEGLSDDDMQQLTRWFNLSETAFLLPPTSAEADYRVRIFTLAAELPFAGHPTLGSCHTWLALGGQPAAGDVVVQECGAGLVTLRRDADSLAFAAPPLLRSGPVDDADLARVVALLGIDAADVVDAQWVDNGPGWVAVLLRDAEAVLDVRPDPTAVEGRFDVGVVGLYPPGAPHAYELRALFSGEHGELREDPVTGSLNASVAQWLIASGRCQPPYLVRQGTALGRRGVVRIDADADGTVWVGGTATTVVTGQVDL